MNLDQKDIITIKEFSELFGFQKGYVYKLIHQGKVKYYKPYGKKVFFKLSEVMEHFEKSKVSDYNEISRTANRYMI
jgi:excisionase family DNA binding protein